MDEWPDDAHASTHVQEKIAQQVAHLQAKNTELEQRYKKLEGKLVEVLAVTEAHTELIQALQAENESLKAAVGVAHIAGNAMLILALQGPH